MELKVENKESIVLISIEGKLDSNTSPEAQKRIMPLITDSVNMVLDMSQCGYISSAGLRVMLLIAKSVSAAGGRIFLAGLCEEVKDVMEMTGFGDIFPNYPTTGEAIEALRKEVQ